MAKGKKQSPEWKYEGFQRPESNYFKMPNEWTDITEKITSLAELKVVEYVLRHTWGYQEYGIAKKITTDEFMNGRKLSSGKRMDKGTGLSNRSVIDGLRRAVEHGLLIEEVDDRDKARIKKAYMLNMRAPGSPKSSDVKKVHTGGKNLHNSDEVSSPRSEKDTLEKNNYVVVKELIRRGITKKIAEQLASDYSDDLIWEKIELLDYLVEIDSPLISRNPAGYLRKAIIEDYEPPKDFQKRAEREAERIKREQLQQEIITEKQAEKEKEQARIDRIISTYQIPPDLIEAWDRVMDQLEPDLQKKVIDQWFRNTHLLSVDDGVATIGVKTSEAKKWLEARAGTMISKLLQGILNRSDIDKVRFEIIDFT